MAPILAHPGSSPRVRGTDNPMQTNVYGRGIIPARAGNSIQSHLGLGSSWDHPRACGEQYTMPRDGGIVAGSSPRVRGTGPIEVSGDTLSGIIPARAGNSYRL